MTESNEPNLQQLAYFGAREKIKSLVEEKHRIDRDIKELKRFIRAGKHKLVDKTRKKMSPAMRKAISKRMKAMHAAKKNGTYKKEG